MSISKINCDRRILNLHVSASVPFVARALSIPIAAFLWPGRILARHGCPFLHVQPSLQCSPTLRLSRSEC
jgi:hypothetical protein